MAQVGGELNEEIDKCCENRGGWVNDRVKEGIAQRTSENREYCYTRRICGVDDVRTKTLKYIYIYIYIYIYEKKRGSWYGFTCS